MAKEVKLHIGILLATVLACFIWVNTHELNRFSLQLSAMLLLFLLISHRFQTPRTFKLTQSITSTIAVIFITTSTGTLASPLFFINSLLLFELSILLEPIIPIVLAFTLILFYFNLGNSQGSVFSYAVLF